MAVSQADITPTLLRSPPTMFSSSNSVPDNLLLNSLQNQVGPIFGEAREQNWRRKSAPKLRLECDLSY